MSHPPEHSCTIGSTPHNVLGRCRPMRNTRYYMLDQRSLQPCPIGVPGECYISGACVAMGYAGQPELTAERFLPNPFKQPGDSHHYNRMYKTGERPGDREQLAPRPGRLGAFRHVCCYPQTELP